MYALRSYTVTSYPRSSRRNVTVKPAIPAPITATRMGGMVFSCLPRRELARAFHKREQCGGARRGFPRFRPRLLGDAVEVALGLRHARRKGSAQRFQIARRRARLAEDPRRLRIADRERGGQRENPVAQIFFAAAAEGGRAAHVAHVVAAVVEQAQQASEPPELVRARAEAGAHLEHR